MTSIPSPFMVAAEHLLAAARFDDGRRADSGGPVLAAGGVLWRATEGRVASPPEAEPGTPPEAEPGIEIAVVHRPKYDDWSLPKGKLDPGEHPLEAAVREIREETGFAAVLGRPLGVSRYQVSGPEGASGQGQDKQVYYWAAQAHEGRFVPHAEIDALDWLRPEAARQRLSRRDDRPLVDALLGGPVRTVPILVLRHAVALPRKSWQGEDEDRPLSPAGEVQARALVGMLAAYGIRRVVSSPSLRCGQTVAPYAEKAAVSIETDAALSEVGHDGDGEAAAALVHRVVADGVPAVLCSHRPVLPTLLAALAEHASAGGFAAVGPRPEKPKPLRKGELLVGHCDRTQVCQVERHLP